MSRESLWTKLSLDDGGRSLVEASAGTGKTWTIAALYLRLLLERELTPRRIVVGTFTKAAAAELAERLRGKLLWALAEAEHIAAGIGEEADPPSDRQWLRGRWRGDSDRMDRDVLRLQAALAEFDAAPISTLHALCSRILAEHPFAAGALFRGREMINGKTLEKSLIDDLWRVVQQGDAADALVVLARAAEIDRGKLRKFVPALLQPDVEVGPQDPGAVAAAVAAVVGDTARWIADVREVYSTGLLSRTGRLGKGWLALTYALESSSPNLADVLAEYHEDLSGAPSLKGVNDAGKNNDLVLKLVELSPRIANAVPPLQLDMASQAPLRSFLAAAQRWCRSALQTRLDAANQSTFDQILVSVRDALQPHEGQRALADALFAEWPVALVDEFQDTDPIQFGILDAIYRTKDGATRGRLVMIGDPKQSIYRFRGGDVQTYERAKSEVPLPDRLTLGTNHRSSRGYVAALNRFYAVTGRKLGNETSSTTIACEDVQASGRQDATPLCSKRDGKPVERPLVLHELEAGPGGGNLEAKVLETRALEACAGQIAWALSEDGYRIADRPLQPGDIAVLLPTNAQIRRLAVLLKARGVPCVATAPTSVFDSDAARDLRLILHALLHPDDAGALRAALATRLGGAGLRDLQALDLDASAWDRQTARFHALRSSLERGGPLEVVARLLEQQAPRLLEATDGERALTDLRHLGELLQEAWLEVGGGERLAAWFADQVDGDAEGGDAADARALRLESDAARVRLMTLHGSKGLEFGVVFLPLMWKHERLMPARNGAQLLSDDEGRRKSLVMDLAKDLVAQQELEERYRMLYVALTRAIHACHVLVLPQGDAGSEGNGKLAKLKDAPINALPIFKLWQGASAAQDRIGHVMGWEAHEGLIWSAGPEADGSRSARPLPPPPAGPLPMRHSFTTLSGGGHRWLADEGGSAEDEQPDGLAETGEIEVGNEASSEPPIAATPHAALEALAKVAGTDFGNAVHALFERRVPGEPIPAAGVLAALKEHGVRLRGIDETRFSRDLAQRLRAVLDTPLRMRADDPPGPRLRDLGAGDMRAEMEFNYLLDGATLRALRKACEANGEPGLVPGHDQALAGVMNGRIDLLFASGGRFHVLDYKGNRLSEGESPRLEDYAPKALETEMRTTRYRFQALLYTLAVERYLRSRLGADYRREAHLGDCWYLFIRAVGLSLPDGTPCGVWHHRFGDGLLDAVQAVLGLPLQEAA